MFLLIVSQLFKMLVILLVGIFCCRIGLVSTEGSRCISNLLLNIVNPCLIITVYQTDYDKTLVAGLLLSFAAALVSHFIAILISTAFIRKNSSAESGLERYAAVYSNCGFIGIPLIGSVLGSEGVFYLTAYMTVFNLLTWTHGLSLMKGNFRLRNLRDGLLSPMVLSTLLAMALFFIQFEIPGPLLDSMNYIADMNTPLAMMVAGFSVAHSNLKDICTNLSIYKVAALKLLVVPLAVLLFLSFLPLDSTVAYTTLIASACPTATTITMMSILYNKNHAYASEIFSFTTVLSILTIPVVISAAELLF
ncbi:MAG TPA: AEC family transporter [Candidatus Blautia intestinavium]|nr:AEC family transporter [Candidatus Blautia intestinavium]